MNETWKNVIEYEGMYEVSDKGRVRSVRGNGNHQGVVLSPGMMTSGYWLVNLCKRGKTKCRPVHRLVAEAFLGNKSGFEINHKNSDKLDNCIENLEWVKHLENMHHAKMMGKIDQDGEKGPNAKLTQKQVNEIRQIARIGQVDHWHATGESQKDIAKRFDVSQGVISRIARCKTYKI